MASCFICDKEVTDEIYLTSSETFFTKTIFVTKISEVMGNDFVVVAAEEDQLCKRCASLLNKSDRLEVDLMETHNTIKRFLGFKYNLIPIEENWTESEKEYSKGDNEPSNLEFEDLLARKIGLSLGDSKDIIHIPEANDIELKKHHFNSDYISKPEPTDLPVENNDKLNKEPFTVPSQNFSESDNFTEKIKLEHDSGEEIYSLEPSQVDNEDRLLLEEEILTSLSTETVELKEKTSIVRSIKTNNKTNKSNSKKGLTRTVKLRPILPKIVKSNDILKLASWGVFESIDPGHIIKIPMYGSNQPVEQSIQTVNENLENTNTFDATVEENSNINDQKKEKKLKCDVCGKECSTKNRLDMHKTIHEKKICDFCGRAFNSHYRLKVHRNIHTKQKKFTCKICGENFIHHSTYWYHRKWHDEPFPYTCEFCGKLFKHSSILAIHRRKHTGERPYKCSYCPLAFTISTTMKKHEMLHTNEFAFNCDVCPKGFTTRTKYAHHMARTHKILDQGSSEPKQRKKRNKVKCTQKQMSPAKSSSSCDIVDGLNTYFPVELEERIEVVVGSETMKIHSDTSKEVANQEKSQFENGDQETNELLIADQIIPVELNEGVVEIVLGPEEYVLPEEISEHLIPQVS